MSVCSLMCVPDWTVSYSWNYSSQIRWRGGSLLLKPFRFSGKYFVLVCFQTYDSLCPWLQYQLGEGFYIVCLCTFSFHFTAREHLFHSISNVFFFFYLVWNWCDCIGSFYIFNRCLSAHDCRFFFTSSIFLIQSASKLVTITLKSVSLWWYFSHNDCSLHCIWQRKWS